MLPTDTSEPPRPLHDALEEASRDLLYISETDAPLSVVDAGPVEPDASTETYVRQWLKLPDDTHTETRTLDDFFANAVAEDDWLTDEEKATARRLQDLIKLLKERLTDIEVVCVGTTEMDAYVLGKTPEQTWAGLKTSLVET